uniref:Membrane insertase YidC/Oxa/ALB C-terminal domain-containing protein n=1 Tax=Plectus sambesii TaxID=2011161 RepID=A0A914V1Q7_9BILA
MLAAHRRPLHFTHSSSSQIRWNSSSTLFGVGGKQVNLTDLGAIPDAPAVPLPAPPEPTVQELWNAGESVLEPLGLWSAYTPPSYIRWGLESIHQNFDVPWWVCIVGLTVTMRLGLIFVPILSQRLSAKLQQHRVPLAKFQERLNDARAEQDKTQMALVFQERMDYQRKHDIKMWRQFLVLAINGGVFMTHFLALKKMAAADMPGFSSEGLWWFQDLAACDPYLILPLVSAVTIGVVAHLGIESGVRADQMNTSWWLPYVMKFGVPTVVFCFTSFYPSALCVYWCTSNAMSLIYAGVFRIPAVRELCK